MASQYQVPATPRVISPSPTPSESSNRDGYFPSTRPQRLSSVEPIEEHVDDDQTDNSSSGSSSEDDPELARARSRSRSSQLERKGTGSMGLGTANGSVGGGGGFMAKSGMPSATAAATSRPTRRKKEVNGIKPPNGSAGPDSEGLLSPESAYPKGYGAAYWRNLSRSPSPLGLIPIHRDWRVFIHKHEVPRKLMHISIGFLALGLHQQAYQPSDIHPILLALLIPILATDLLRFRWPAFNAFYIRCLGPFMRESEAHDRFNGVIGYLAGIWFTMRFCRKDVAVVSVLLLSWGDAAASTFGRLWGKYTPRIRRGKSLAGSLAAFVVGVGAAVVFWGWIVPGGDGGIGVNRFAFDGSLTLPKAVREAIGMSFQNGTIDGPLALAVVGVTSGLAASVSEAIDLWGLDDNLTIPILCGMMLGAFFWAFGGQ